MHPHTPQDRRAFDRPDWKANEPKANEPKASEPHIERTRIEDRTSYSGTALLMSIVLLFAIFVLVAVL